MKLGALLIKEGLITKEQLKLALERQVIFGGRVGTNIVELGILTEDELIKFLGRYLKISVVEPHQLIDIDKETIASMTKEMADKYKAVPFKKEKNRLHVAMLKPEDLALLDDFRFVSGYDIVPYVSSELRILYALEKYYGIKRDLRYISIFDSIETGNEKKKAPIESTDEEEILSAEENLDIVKEAFANVKDKEEIADLLVNETKKIAKRVALFMLKGNNISGWSAKGLNVQGTEIDINQASAFNTVLVTKTKFKGPILSVPSNEGIIKMLGGAPKDSLIVPISIKDRAIGLLYADNGLDSTFNKEPDYPETLVEIASVAFTMLILRNKILNM